MISALALRRCALAAVCAVALAIPLHLSASAEEDASVVLPAPGSLARFVSAGSNDALPVEGYNGFYTTNPDGSEPAHLIKQRPFTDEDRASGATNASITRFAVSPDGLHVAAWVRDPEGYVVPGGTPSDSAGQPGRTGEALVLFDISGTFLRVLVENRRIDSTYHQDVHNTFEDITWLDMGHLLVAGYQTQFAGTSEEWSRGVLRQVDIATGAVGAVISIEDGTLRGKHIDRGWAGGGTVLAVAERSAFVFTPDAQMVELPKALTTDDPTHEGYDGGAVSPDGRHIAVSYAGPRDENGTRPLIDVFDRELDGSWTRRHLTVAELGRSATWVKWLPYTDYADATLLLPLDREDAHDVAAVVRVGPGVAPGDRIAEVLPEIEGPWTWQPIPVPPAGAGTADVSVALHDTTTSAGQAWTGRVRVTNRGPDRAEDLTLDVELGDEPATSLTIGDTACADGTCRIPALAVGEQVDVFVSDRFAATGVVPLSASVTTSSLDWNPGNSTAATGVRITTQAHAHAAAGRVVHQERNGGTIVVSNPDGTGRKVLATPPADGSISLMEVHGNTGLVLWRNDDTFEYTLVGVDGNPVRSFTLGASSGLAVALSPDARTAYFVQAVDAGGDGGHDDRFRLVEQRLDVANAAPRVRREMTGALPKGLRVSPDGTRLAYLVQPIGDYIRSIGIEDLDFARPPRTVGLAGHGDVRPNNVPAWSPDSGRVAVAVGDFSPFDPAGKVLAAALDGSVETMSTTTEALWVSDWSPDGDKVILNDLDRSATLDVATGTVTPLIQRPAWWSGQALSTSPSPSPTANPSTSPSSTPSPTDSPTVSPNPTTSPTSTPTTTPGPDPTSSQAPDTAAPTGAFTLSPSKYVRRGRSVTLTRTRIADDHDSAADVTVRVTWGDGTTDTVTTGSTTKLTHTYQSTSRPVLRVSLSDRAGNTARVVNTALVVDGTAPKVALTVPSCGSRRGSSCTSYLDQRARWSTIRGTASDTYGSGVSSIKVRLVQQRGSRWYAYVGSRWSRQSSQTKALAAASLRTASRPSSSTWSIKAPGLTSGKMIVTFVATDRAGNARTGTYARTLR